MKNKGKIVGYTTGVFDLFHIGHLNILKNAKSECDYLIVGITTDELAYSLKGKLPVIPFFERKSIVESIRYVDKVVAQKEINEINDWEKYRFNKIFKGGDWKNSKKWCALEKKFASLGVSVVFFPYTQNTSSTYLKSILDKI